MKVKVFKAMKVKIMIVFGCFYVKYYTPLTPLSYAYAPSIHEN